ncbi:MAG TPA: hypothetical protein VF784_00440 [Anaerolineales bacterium]
MDDACCSNPSAGAETCELVSASVPRSPRKRPACPVCGQKGKPVQTQTVKALLSVTLREVQAAEYLFCRTEDCPVVYYSADGIQTFTTEHVRERVYQKEPANEDVLVCYCFRHRVGEISRAQAEARQAILEDIDSGIRADQCACDLRNPQGSCCLGNVKALIKQLQEAPNSMQRSQA